LTSAQWITVVLVPLGVAIIGAVGSLMASRSSAVDEINRAKIEALQEVGQFPGEIRMFAGEACPRGWLECDGAPLPREGPHAKLFAAIGTAWGYPDSLTFFVPDLRGVFLRGWNHQQGDARLSDPDVGKRESFTKASNGKTGDHVGSFQKSEVGGHGHEIVDGGHAHDVASSQQSSAGGDPPGAADTRGNGQNTGHALRTSASSSNIQVKESSGKETRPTNAYVLYCIKDG
jgi:microcystin-dependent protein